MMERLFIYKIYGLKIDLLGFGFEVMLKHIINYFMKQKLFDLNFFIIIYTMFLC